MIAQDFLNLLKTKPFVPFRIIATDGRSYDVHHPDQIIVTLTFLVLPHPSENEIPEHVEHLAISHILRTEHFSTDTIPTKGDGNQNGN